MLKLDITHSERELLEELVEDFIKDICYAEDSMRFKDLIIESQALLDKIIRL